MSYNIDTIHEFGNLPFAADDTNAAAGGKFVNITSTGQVAVAAAAGGAHGVLRAGVTAGFAPAVAMGGFPQVLAEEDLPYGADVGIGPNGGARIAVTGTTPDVVVGVVVQPGSAGTTDARIKLAE